MFWRTLSALLLSVLPLHADDSIIKIVSSLPRTGAAKEQTDSLVNGIRLALEEAGHKAGKFKVVYDDLDDATATSGRWDWERETGNANEALKDTDVMIYIGPFNSGAAQVSMPLLNQGDLLMISPACTYPGLTKADFGRNEPDRFRPSKKLNFIRLPPSDDWQGPAAARFVHEELRAKSVFILDDGEIYGKHVAAEYFKKECGRLKLEVLGQETVDYRQKDFSQLLLKIKENRPDVVYFGGTSQVAGPEIARDMSKNELKSTLIVADGCFDDEFIKRAGPGAFKNLKCYCSVGGIDLTAPEGKSVRDFVDRYKKKYKNDPLPYAVYGYESVRIAIEAIRAAGKKDRDLIRTAALKIKDFATSLGKITIDNNGDATPGAFTIHKVEDGKFKPVKEMMVK